MWRLLPEVGLRRPLPMLSPPQRTPGSRGGSPGGPYRKCCSPGHLSPPDVHPKSVGQGRPPSSCRGAGSGPPREVRGHRSFSSSKGSTFLLSGDGPSEEAPAERPWICPGAGGTCAPFSAPRVSLFCAYVNVRGAHLPWEPGSPIPVWPSAKHSLTTRGRRKPSLGAGSQPLH